jgi:uncharacterized protein (TIGR00725 family)
MNRYQIGVFGSEQKHLKNYKIAYEVGKEIGKRGHILVSGGLGGIMEASCRGAKNSGGITIGIIPTENFSGGNKYLDVKILTNMGEGRNTITGLSCHGCIIIGGSEGTLCEAKIVYDGRGPVVAIQNTGGTADFLIKNSLPSMTKKPYKIYKAKGPADAVDMIIRLIKKHKY